MKNLFLQSVLSLFLTSLAICQTIDVQSFMPTSGSVGDTVTITGIGFNATTNKNIVRFGGVKANVISSSGTTTIVATVPAGASYGLITVTDTSAARKVTGYSVSPFAVTYSALRTIDAEFFPNSTNFDILPGNSPKGIAIGDIDGDGKPDVVLAFKGSRRIAIYRNLGSSPNWVDMANPVQDTLGTSTSKPYAVALGDLDGDGDLDIAISDSSSSNVFVWVNGSTPGTIAKTNILTLTAGTNPCGVAIGDLNGDGRPEIVTANKGSNNVSVLKDTVVGGVLTFLAAKNYVVGTAPVDVEIADMDNDGGYEPDIVVANSTGNSVTILQNQAYPSNSFIAGSFLSALSPTVGTTPLGLAIADVDGDLLPDILTANSGSTKVSVLLNVTGFSNPISFNPKVDFEIGTNPFDIAVGDINGDGKPEALVVQQSVDSLVVLRNTSTSGVINSSSFATKVSFMVGSPGSSPSGVAIGDLNRDGKSDVAVATALGNPVFSAFRNRALKTELESNNTATNANSISIGESVDGTILPNTDVDYFKFFAYAGDTVEIFVNMRNNSGLRGALEVTDSLGSYVSANNWWWRTYWPRDTSLHSIYVIPQSRTYYVRYNYANGTGYAFPNSAPPGREPAPQKLKSLVPAQLASSAAGVTATGDTGAYRLRLERFTPSAPDVQYYSGYYNTDHNFARVQGQLSANGAPTTITFEYGTTPGSFTNSVPGVPSTVNGIVITYTTGDLTSLAPNSRYYYRMKAANSFGTKYTDGNDWFTTPPAPDKWVFQSTGTENEFYGSSFVNATTGWIVGAGGPQQIYNTTDGGNSWQAQNQPTGWALYGVTFRNSQNGLAVGDYGTVVKTTDGGTTWTDQSNASYRAWTYSLYAVRYFSSSTAIAVGQDGTIMRSTDSWNTWNLVRHGASTLNAISVVSTTTAYAVGANGTILRTTNSGASWDSLGSGTTSNLQTAYFFNQSTGFVAGSGYTLRKTTNGGATWTAVTLPQTQNDPNYLLGMAFSDASKGIIVGDAGAILRTTNGGETWSRQSSGTYRRMWGTSYYGRSAMVVGERGLVLNYLDPIAETESNDTPASANLISYRDEIDARIDPADMDFYKFVAAASDTVAVFVQSRDTAVVNGILQLRDTDGIAVLESNDDFVPGDTVRSRVVCILPAPGTYYIRYIGKSSAVSGNYRLSLNKADLKPIVPFGGVATIVTTSQVILKSPVIPNNVSTTVQFEYGPTTTYGTTVTADSSPVTGQRLVNATKTLSGLTPFAEYHFRVKAQNAGGTTYGPDVTFQTALGMLRVETESNNTSSTANTIFIGDTVQATLSTNTDVDYYRFQAAAGDSLEIFLTERNASGLDSKIEVYDSSSNNMVFGYANDFIPDSKHLHVAFVAGNTGVYHIRQTWSGNWNTNYPNQAARGLEPMLGDKPKVVAGSAASDNGAYELRFRRFVPSAPDVRKYPWADVAFAASALIHCDVTSNGFPTTVYVEYGTTPSLGSSVQYSGGPVTELRYQFWFRIPLTGLTAGTTYYFRIKAVNAVGTSYSDIATFSTAPASDKWIQKFPNTDRTLSEVSAVNDSLAISLGWGQIFRTTNAGTTWTEISPPRYPYTISFKDADTAFAMGYSIIRSVDKGATWQFYQDFPTNTYAARLRFYNAQIGAAVGGQYDPNLGRWVGGIVRTLDGGSTWQSVHSFDKEMVDVSFVSADTVRAIDYYGWLHRTDNFTSATPTWDSVQVTNEGTQGLKFFNGSTGIVVGSRIWRTTNGGTSWTQVLSPNYYTYDVAMKNNQVGIAVGGYGQIYRTFDSGATWTQEASGATTWIFGASYKGRTAIAVGEVGTVLYSIDPLGEQEPNNTSGTANAFAIGDQMEGSIATAGDVDYFSFAAATNDTLEVLLTAGNSGSPVNGALQLIGTNGTAQLAQNDDFVAGDTTKARIVYNLTAAGTYYVRVAGSTASSTGTYLLKLRRTTLKPNIVSASATVTPSSASITGLVDPNLLSTTVQVQWDTSTAYSKTPVAINEGTLSGQQRRPVTATLSGLTENKDYYFRLVATNAAGTATGSDILFHTPRASALAETASPNDSAHQAQLIAFGDSVNGRIDTLTDVDYYKLHLSGSDTVEVFASQRGSSTLQSMISFYDSSSGGGIWGGWDYWPNANSPHYVTVPNGVSTLYLRYVYTGNPYSYPHGTNDQGPPQFAGGESRAATGAPPQLKTEMSATAEDGEPVNFPTSIGSVASNDTGSYRLYVRRFQRGMPENENSSAYNFFWNSATFQTAIRPNGLSTNVTFQYGPTTTYGSQVSAINGPWSDIYPFYVNSSEVTGLTPGTIYHVRSIASNSAGSDTSLDYSWTTPAAPDGWSRQTTGGTYSLRGISFPTATTAYAAAGYNGVLKSTDGGTSWQIQTGVASYFLYSIAFSNDLNGVVVGDGGAISWTTNGGTNWQTQTSNTSSALLGVTKLGTDTAIAVGQSGTVVKTTNGGTTWNVIQTGKSYHLWNVKFAPASDIGYAFVYSPSNMILRTTNRGNSWDSLALGVSVSVRDGWFMNDTTGFAVGSGRTVLRTTNAGASWTSTVLPAGGTMNSIAFTDISNGIIAESGGYIHRTYDGGANWTLQSSGTTNSLYGVAFKGKVATAVGNYGTVLRAVGLLAAPGAVTATYVAKDSVTISFADNTASESGFYLERKTGAAGTYSQIKSLGPNITATVNTYDLVTRGAIYYYRARAWAASDTSTYAAEDSAFVPLVTPTALDATSGGSNRINLAWQITADARTGFRIERSTALAGPYSQIDSVGSGITSYSNTGLTSGSKYYYRIRSYNAAMASSYSNIDSARTALSKPQSIAANPSSVTNAPITISWSGPSGAANAWYNVDTKPTLSAPSTQVPLTGNSFVLTSPPLGSRWIYVVLQDAEGNADLTAYDSVRTQFDNVAPQITDQTTLPTITITGSTVSDPTSLTFTASVAKPGGIAPLQNPVLQYKKTNSSSVNQSPFPSTSGGSVNVGSLGTLFLTIGKPNGAEYRIVASDAAGNTASTSWRSFTVFVGAPPVSDFVPPAAGTTDDITTLVSNYRLFSAPYDLSDKKPGTFMETVDKGLGPHAKDGVNYYNWRMQRYVNSTYQDYEDFKTQDVLTPGTAFFLVSRQQKSVTVGSGNLVKAQDMFNSGIQVLQGWNLVGNPFPDDFPADSMDVLAGSIANKAYYDGTGPDGGWWKTGSNLQWLKKWEGLAINVTQSTSLRFKAVPQTSEKAPTPVPLAKAPQQVIEEQKEGGWLMRFDAHRSGSSIVDVGNLIGEAPGAKEGYDSFDSYQPPIVPGKSLAVYFKNPDGAMSNDIRPIQTNGSAWEMKVVTGDRGARVKLDVSEVVVTDPGLEAYLLDIDDHMAHNLKEQRNVEFGSKEGIRNFRVVVGSKGFVDSVSASLGIDLVPQIFMLYQNYPNPFNPETALRFWLPGAAPSYKVSLKVYNIIGQEVATLVDRTMRAGYYETTFSGRNMSSGTYVYRLTVDGGTKETSFSAVKKMVMVK